MRSLRAKNPFKSAHDSLVGLFEDTATKVALKLVLCICILFPKSRILKLVNQVYMHPYLSGGPGVYTPIPVWWAGCIYTHTCLVGRVYIHLYLSGG